MITINNVSRFIRATKKNPCPICGRKQWCSVTADGALALCMKVNQGSVATAKNGAFIHVLKDRPRGVHAVHLAEMPAPLVTLETLANRARLSLSDSRRDGLAKLLGLSVDSLVRLRMGWSTSHGAFTFPMIDTGGHVVGIRLRFLNGQKLSVKGGHEAIFIPDDLQVDSLLLVTEGPTDCAAMLDLGFAAVGRPSCTGGTRLLADLVKQSDYSGVAIMADADAPGQRGAEALASVLTLYAPGVRVVTPPADVKDCRAWKVAGATHDDIAKAIHAAPVRTISIRAGGEL